VSAPELSTTYLGLALESPLVASSCPLTGELSSALALQAAGAGALVLPSLFQEQVEHEELALDRLQAFGAESQHEAVGYFPELESYNSGPDGYLRLVASLRAHLRIPVIASLNGVSADGWERYARRIESAGAHALELNLLYVPTDPELSAEDVERLLAAQVRAVTAAVSIPVAVKLGTHLTAPAHFARRLGLCGARGLVLFNRFLEPDIDLETLGVVPRLELSRPSEMRLVLRWTAILSASTELSLGATGGVHSAQDALKLILAGADAVLLASVLLRRGPAVLETLLAEMRQWLREHDCRSIEQVKGSVDHARCPDPAGYERLNYMRALTSFSS
jgi:dihydroorotate dehydrogenase (fumarate)